MSTPPDMTIDEFNEYYSMENIASRTSRAASRTSRAQREKLQRHMDEHALMDLDKISCNLLAMQCTACGEGFYQEQPPTSEPVCSECIERKEEMYKVFKDANSNPTWRDEFDQFCKQMYSRLLAGDQEYGDKSWQNPADMSASEVCEELSDVSGWSFQVWRRMQTLIKRLKELEGAIK